MAMNGLFCDESPTILATEFLLKLSPQDRHLKWAKPARKRPNWHLKRRKGSKDKSTHLSAKTGT